MIGKTKIPAYLVAIVCLHFPVISTAAENLNKGEFVSVTLNKEVISRAKIENGYLFDYYSAFKIISIPLLITLLFIIWNRKLLNEINYRKKIEGSLNLSESSFRDILQHFPDSACLIDDNNFIETNLAAIQCLGYKNENEVLSHSPSVFSPEFQPDGQLSLESCHEYIAKAKGGHIQRFEWIYIKKNGSPYPVEVTLAPCQFKGKTLVYCTWRDITERKNDELQLQQLTNDLDIQVRLEVEKNKQKDILLLEQSKSAAMGKMIGNIAHQWRQPLNSLNLVLHDLQDAYAHNECDSVYFKGSVSEANGLITHMSQTIDNFRNFFKTQDYPAPFSLKAIIIDCMNVMHASMKFEHIDISLNCEDDLVDIIGFQHELAEVVLSLLGNAREAILSQNTNNALISINVATDGANSIVTICDNGGGIPDEIMPKIFDPSFSSKSQGTGMGLYMSRIIMTEHLNGQINAKNISNGACFELIVPANIHIERK